MRLIISAILATMLAACGTTPPPPDAAVVASEKQSTNIDPALIKACEPFKQLDRTKTYTPQDQSTAIGIWASQYDDCAGRFAKFVAIVTPVLNINMPPASK